MSVRDLDHGAKRTLAALEDLAKNGARVTVGVHEEDGRATEHDSELSVAELAVIHEFEKIGGRGSKIGGRKRQRAWLRNTVAKQRTTLGGELAIATEKHLRGVSIEDAFGTPGRSLLRGLIEASGEDKKQLHRAMRVRVRGKLV